MEKIRNIALTKYVRFIKPVVYLYLAIMTVIVCGFSSNSLIEMLWENERFVIVVISSICLLMILLQFIVEGTSLIKTFVLQHIVVIGMALLLLLPYEYRPLSVIAMILTILASEKIGLVCAISMSIATSFLIMSEPEYLYGVAIIMVMGCIAANLMYKGGIMGIISPIIYVFLVFFINGIFQYYLEEEFDYSFAFKSLIGTVLSLIITVVVILYKKPVNFRKYTSDHSELVLKMKDESLSLYYHSLEVAEISKEAAQIIKCNKRLAFAGGMIHDIGKMRGKDYIKEGLKLANEYHMSRALKAIIVEHSTKYRNPKSKESAIIMLADSVVASIEHLKREDKEVDESKIIENVFRIRIMSGALDECSFTISEFAMIKQAFLSHYGFNNELTSEKGVL